MGSVHINSLSLGEIKDESKARPMKITDYPWGTWYTPGMEETPAGNKFLHMPNAFVGTNFAYSGKCRIFHPEV